MNWLIVVLIVFQFESLKAASNWFVSPTGNDKFDGSQEKPFLTINHANTVATDKDTITLFPGVYSGTNRNCGLVIQRNITITSLTQNPSQSIIECSLTSQTSGVFTIMSLSFVLDSISINGSFSTAIRVQKGTTKIVNCLLENNNGKTGGAISVAYTSSLILSKVTARGNKASTGAVAHLVSTANLYVESDCHFFGNNAGESGGVFHVTSRSHISIKRALFESNSAGTGGAIYLNDVVGDINDCQFTGNKADKEGGSVSLTHDSNINMERCTFMGNYAGTLGGSIYMSHGGALNQANNDFSNNTAQKGAAIALDWDNCLMNGYDNTYEYNDATQNGGAIFVSKGRISSSNEQFWDNHADSEGGTFFISSGDVKLFDGSITSSNAPIAGGGIYCSQGSTVALTDTSVSSCSSQIGAALFCKDGRIEVTKSDLQQNELDNNVRCDKCEWQTDNDSCTCQDC